MTLAEILSKYNKAEKHVVMVSLAQSAFKIAGTVSDWENIIDNIPAEDILDYVEINADDELSDPNTDRKFYTMNIETSDALILELDSLGKILIVDVVDIEEAKDQAIEFELSCEGGYEEEDED